MNPYQHSFGGNIPQDVAGKQGENVIFIVYTLKDSPETLDKVKDVCANFSALIRSMRNRFPDMMFSCTMGFGADAWNRLFPEQGKPKELKTFEEIKGEKHTAVSTPGDLLFHIRAKQMGLCFEFASIIDEKLQGVVEPVDETHGFRYMDGKAIIGFYLFESFQFFGFSLFREKTVPGISSKSHGTTEHHIRKTVTQTANQGREIGTHIFYFVKSFRRIF